MNNSITVIYLIFNGKKIYVITHYVYREGGSSVFFNI